MPSTETPDLFLAFLDSHLLTFPHHFCLWGVTCNEGRVIGLDLAHEFISGGIDNSSSLFSLQHLESLSLADNYFNPSYEISSKFDKLVNLSYLNLAFAGFTEQISIAISHLTRLVTLDLSIDYYNYKLKLENPNLTVLVQNLSELMELHLDGFIISRPFKQPDSWRDINKHRGTIPQCLFEMTGTLRVLDLRRNKLNATIPDAFPNNCGLKTLALNQNQLQGGLPKSLANCIRLDILDIGNKYIKGTFPLFLKNTIMLSVLVLRSNKFYESITHPELNVTWPMLQILDIASNNFTDKLPITLFLSSMAMMDREHEAHSELTYLQVYTMDGFYYQDTVTITSKGLEMELVKILTIFTTIDLSCNNFDGHIPDEIGQLTLLYVLNLWHNPSIFGKIESS
ncbi:hypothetical protein FH972_005795 [Carpinus fangiana]|uniref:Leucine-rich repeat-containing N-terminal plant-type domain-containing protein n=1 Tax=Carpinus fangiana TaxID=176857 RepID=A0A5N6QQB8_9ROSI|nr:hypothetical protein FH972_005795 [Carpinus fangiana]